MKNNLPKSPFEIIEPEARIPIKHIFENDFKDCDIINHLRIKVYHWRKSNYIGASNTTKALFEWWFNSYSKQIDLFFAQREAIETIVYCKEILKIKKFNDLIKLVSGDVNNYHKLGNWVRLVTKMATGSGKTKVISLVILWSYFNKKYEDNDFSNNFILIAPNIIVLDRLRTDFENLDIYNTDKTIPYNGFMERNWLDDFKLTVHIQNKVKKISDQGNLFLTNIHRLYNDKNKSISSNDYLDDIIGVSPTSKNKNVNLLETIYELEEIMVINDEAHHIHNKKLQWYISIENIFNHYQKNKKHFDFQIDFTATPRDENGFTFIQTISDYPLAEAIYQNLVKEPILPDKESRSLLTEYEDEDYIQRYKEFIDLGYEEWKKYNIEFENHAKPILFIMTEDTLSCDEVARYLIENPRFEEFQTEDEILVIHTKENGELFDENSNKNKEEIKKLRDAAKNIDNIDSPYKAIISVLMLKEGWDVKNVTTILGLRAYSSSSNILPEQTLGRGLRKMFGLNIHETLSVVGTNNFLDLIESLKNQGIDFQEVPMIPGSGHLAPLIIRVDFENKAVEKLDINIPLLLPRIHRDYKDLQNLDLNNFIYNSCEYIDFNDREIKPIIFREFTTDDIDHKIELEIDFDNDFQDILGIYTRTIINKLQIIGFYNVLYGLVLKFVTNYLFGKKINTDDKDFNNNLREQNVRSTIIDTFIQEINKLNIVEQDNIEIIDHITISNTPSFPVNSNQDKFNPRKCIFNYIVGDSKYEVRFAEFLDNCKDIISFTKNYLKIGFKIEYIDADNNISNYYPDFIVRRNSKEVYIIETKGLADENSPLKRTRLKQWCKDLNNIQSEIKYYSLYIKQKDYDKYPMGSFKELVARFTE